MKRILTKFIITFLAVCISASALLLAAGCGDKTKYDFTIWVMADTISIDNLGNADVFKEMERITGKKIKFIMDSGDKLQMLFSTNEYPDAILTILGDAAGYPGGMDKGISDGVILDLTDLINEHAPNYKAFVNSDPDIKREVITDNGRMGAMYAVSADTQGPWWGYVMRKDLLVKYADNFTFAYDEEAGCKIPVTYSDWTQVLWQMKKPKSQGGEGMASPLFLNSSGSDMFDFLSAGFGVMAGFYNEDGTVKYGPKEQGFKDYLEQIQNWYAGGFIHASYNLNNILLPGLVDTIGNQNTAPSVMAFPYVYTLIDGLEKDAKAIGIENFELVAVPAPKANANDQLHIRNTNARIGAHVLITKKCSDPAGLVSWFDYFYSTEGSLLANYGTEGKTYTMVEGKPVFTETFKNEPDFYKYATHAFPTVYDWRRELQVISPKAINAMTVWETDNDGSYLLSPAITLTTAEGARETALMVDINTYVTENVMKFIKGQLALSNFDSFVQQLKTLGIEEVIANKQAGLNRFNTRQV